MLTVQYTCVVCLTFDRAVRVRYREPDEDVVKWVEGPVIRAIAENHSAHRPSCPATKLTHLKIPVPKDSNGVGLAP